MKMYLALVLACLAVSVMAGSSAPSEKSSDVQCYGGAAGRKINIKCTVCKALINMVKSIIGDHVTPEIVRNALNTVCDKLASGMQSTCRTIVVGFADVLIPLLVDQVPTKKICKKIKMCKGLLYALEAYSQGSPAISQYHVSPGCAMCQLIMAIVEDLFGQGKSEEEVSDAVERACLALPYDIRQECVSMAAIVLNRVNTTSSLVGVCYPICFYPRAAPSTYAASTQCADVEEGFSITCDQCTPIMDFIRKKSQNLPSNDVVDNLDAYCLEMEAALAPSCLTYMTAFEPVVVDQIISGSSSKQTCKAINMC